MRDPARLPPPYPIARTPLARLIAQQTLAGWEVLATLLELKGAGKGRLPEARGTRGVAPPAGAPERATTATTAAPLVKRRGSGEPARRAGGA